MKIIKSGKKPKPMRGTCQGCGCKVEVVEKETKFLAYDRDHVPGAATRYVKCPECKRDFLWVK
jgi:hypothetical protein